METIGKHNKLKTPYLARAIKTARAQTGVTGTTSNVTNVFCYGTLNIHDVQRGVWGEAKEGKCGHIYDYEMKMYSSNIFYLERKPGESVAGKVYKLNEEQLIATDAYETSAYKRVTIKGTTTQDTVDTYVRNT